MNSQSGFTLLELVIAMAIFALLGLASWSLFDGLVRVQRGTATHDRDLRNLQRAMALIEWDVLHVTEQAVVLKNTTLQVQRSNWRNPLDQPRSQRQQLTYRLENGVLWRDSMGEGSSRVQRQKLLEEVQAVSWRLYDPATGWRGHSILGQYALAPMALEVRLSVGRFDAIRRVLLLPAGLQ
ncbi:MULTISPECIES: type II secretion system minor pseudopilin GspJ [Pseudomonas]|jgi:general secretion pathway protein J|uniref:Type II secretion system protein J n=1 Tax=Pseudomonas yamanorum TaxID=515393 RepID=A0A7Y8EN99_9PSED|nr:MULTISPECIES: type II secretion system minor pseudopilin GspJ [Pseudomonas]NVZ86000.1 type II secretion system minor pseudopilin GspJ [Pseudomonas yamanorum]NWE17285.1 type II secretion system minor pseudopilin GspJ [Pseudomonas yamanorum]NWE79592.1 type II secretion system minor pseudopilin GspJ [Pseudomonas yamanorum]